MEDVVVSFAGRTSPDVRQGVSEFLHVFQVSQEDDVVDGGPEHSRPEEVHRVEVGDVDPSRVGCRTLAAVLLHVHPEEADVDTVNLLKGKQGASTVRELFTHLTSVDESVNSNAAAECHLSNCRSRQKWSWPPY